MKKKGVIMAFRKKTLRQTPETTRKLARMVNQLESVTAKLKNLIPLIQDLELDSHALANAKMLMSKVAELEQTPGTNEAGRVIQVSRAQGDLFNDQTKVNTPTDNTGAGPASPTEGPMP